MKGLLLIMSLMGSIALADGGEFDLSGKIYRWTSRSSFPSNGAFLELCRPGYSTADALAQDARSNALNECMQDIPNNFNFSCEVRGWYRYQPTTVWVQNWGFIPGCEVTVTVLGVSAN